MENGGKGFYGFVRMNCMGPGAWGMGFSPGAATDSGIHPVRGGIAIEKQVSPSPFPARGSGIKVHAINAGPIGFQH